MNTGIIMEAIGLLNSMVACGEEHSDQSREVVAAARNALDELSEKLKGPYAETEAGENLKRLLYEPVSLEPSSRGLGEVDGETVADRVRRKLAEQTVEGASETHTTYAEPDDPPDIEALAAAEHESWSGWLVYMFERLRREYEEALRAATYRVVDTLREDGSPDTTAFVLREFDNLGCVRRWTRQMETSYDELPPEEQESDRIEARKKLKVYRTNPTED